MGHEVPPSEPETASTREEAPANPPARRNRGSVPPVVYGAMVAALVALVYLLWPSDEVRLQVKTDPAGAEVFLDGEPAGTAPVALGGLQEGHRYTLRAEMEGYQPYEEEFVAHSQEDPWRITLKRGRDDLLDKDVVRELVGQIGESGQTRLYSDELAKTLFTVNPLIEQNPWLTEDTWTQIFQEVIDNHFGGDKQEFLGHLRDYRAELARGTTSKQAWYQHVHKCEKVCRPVVTEVFKRHLLWLRRTGFAVVYFPLDMHELDEEDRAAIRAFIEKHNLREDRAKQILLVGRASKIGGQQYNLELSLKRVAAVVDELANQLPDGRDRLRSTHLGFEPPQISRSVAEFLGLDASLSKEQLNQSVMLIVSEPLPATRPRPA